MLVAVIYSTTEWGSKNTYPIQFTFPTNVLFRGSIQTLNLLANFAYFNRSGSPVRHNRMTPVRNSDTATPTAKFLIRRWLLFDHQHRDSAGFASDKFGLNSMLQLPCLASASQTSPSMGTIAWWLTHQSKCPSLKQSPVGWLLQFGLLGSAIYFSIVWDMLCSPFLLWFTYIVQHLV